MVSDETKLEPINDTLNPVPSRFGTPWYAILGILSMAVCVFCCRVQDCWPFDRAGRIGFRLVAHQRRSQIAATDPAHLLLPSEYDPGK